MQNIDKVLFTIYNLISYNITRRKIVSQFHERYARLHLQRLRDQFPLGRTEFDFDRTAETLRGWLADGNLTLSDIGSSEEELEELRIEFYLREAIRGLSMLRDLTACNRDVIIIPLEEAGKTLADIGTSELELRQLDVAYCRQAADKLLQEVRHKGEPPPIKLQRLAGVRYFVTRGGIPLGDIGTSEEELLTLEL